jgi:hypothetical protein
MVSGVRVDVELPGLHPGRRVPAGTRSGGEVGQMTTESPDLTVEQVAYYRQVLVVHATKPELRACAVCGVSRCPDWIDAYDILAAAYQVMADAPKSWDPFRSRSTL